MQNAKRILSKLPKKTLVTVFPHPDDETMVAGGLLIVAKELGFRTVILSLTAGGAGKIFVHARGKSLKEVREMELRKAGKLMGVDEVRIGTFDDGRLRGGEQTWGHWVSEQLSEIDPGLVVTYDHSGFYGHPDHIALSLWLTEWYKKHQRETKMWYMSVPPEFREVTFIRGMSEVKRYMVEPQIGLEYGWEWIRKYLAARAHKSQGLGKGMPVPLWMFMAKYRREWYHEVDCKRKYNYGYIDYEI